MKLILGEKTNETLRSIYDYLKNSKNEQVVWLEEQDIINELVIQDSISENGTAVRWRYQEIEISPEHTTGVLNYLSISDKSLFNNFIEEDREYVLTEFNSYLAFALNEFNNVLNPPWGESLTGYCHSLPYQWKFVEQSDTNIKVPISYFSQYKDVPNYLLTGFNTIVSDNAYDGRHWVTGIPKKLANDEHYLFYQRPRGIPFVVTALDNHMWSQSLSQPISTTQSMEEVAPMCLNLMDHFHLRMAEILFFFDAPSNVYTFGSINPYMDINKIPSNNRNEWLEVTSTIL